MTFDARESSVYSGEPFELYRWSLGSRNWFQTASDTRRTALGDSYDPFALIRTEVDQNGESASGNVRVTLDLDNPVAQLFLPSPPSLALSLIVTCGHEGETETACVFTGRVMSAKFEEVCEFTCAPRQAVWKQLVPALSYQSQCPLRVFTARCGVDKSLWKITATLSAVSGSSIQSAAFAAKPDGHFSGGWIEANGERRPVMAHVGSLLTLQAVLPGIGPGSQVDAYPGCQGTEADCGGRYSNLVNHLGFKRIPSRQPFDSGGI